MHVTGKWTRLVSPSRRTALLTLQAVAQGAYASDDLRERSQSLSPRDAALAAQLVFGCLRYQAQLDYLIAHYSGRLATARRQPQSLVSAARAASGAGCPAPRSGIASHRLLGLGSAHGRALYRRRLGSPRSAADAGRLRSLYDAWRARDCAEAGNRSRAGGRQVSPCPGGI